MTTIDMVIADDCREYNNLVFNYFTKYTKTQQTAYNFNIVGNAFNGKDAIGIIMKTKPDIVLLDLVMPEVDGLGVMEYINSSDLDKKPIFVILTSVRNERIKNMSMLNGVGAFFIKPTDLQLIANRMALLMNDQVIEKRIDEMETESKINLESLISDIVEHTGVRTHYKGYKYVVKCVKLSIEHPEYLCLGITKQLYPQTGKHFGTTAQRVERDIRNAIQNAFASDSFDYFHQLANLPKTAEKIKPTTGFYISTIVNYLNSNY